ncbi:MAG: hypothetical protein IT323_08190 [Anaerolineae bacterium]|nr:hypothetical protein [Anaerolineae bacterium]
MSRQLLAVSLIVIVTLVLAPAAAVNAQDGPVYVLTEQQINADFSIPSTAARRISDLAVDVQPDGVHISFKMTTVKDGTSNTLSIIAILIGLFQPRVSSLDLENTLISSFSASPALRREVSGMITRAWRDYMAQVAASAETQGLNLTKVTYVTHLMESEGINFFAVEPPSGPGE